MKCPLSRATLLSRGVTASSVSVAPLAFLSGERRRNSPRLYDVLLHRNFLKTSVTIRVLTEAAIESVSRDRRGNGRSSCSLAVFLHSLCPRSSLVFFFLPTHSSGRDFVAILGLKSALESGCLKMSDHLPASILLYNNRRYVNYKKIRN